jgi:hypothetical protein
MKYALNHKTTMRLLQLSSPGNWSTLSFFFHDRGSDIQKSIHGLMEELVYQLLSEHRNLIALVCHLRLRQLIEISGKPQRPGAPVFDSRTTWNKDELEEAKRILDTVTHEERQSTWPLEQLEKAFEIITTQSTVPLKICLFIDALDEHSGDHGRLLAVIRRLEQKDATDTVILKICVSSRPEPGFVVAFASCPQFKVHHHTRDDIARYAQGCLKSSSNASTAELDVAQLEKLGAEVTKKADGVFIWVRLVIQELVEEFVNGSSFTQLWQLLSTLPKELKDLYSRILQKRKPEYKDEFYLMCRVMLKTHSPLSLENLLLVIDVNLTGQWSNLSAESMVRRLSSRSGGLIEVVSQRNDDTVRANDGVQFIHKTFKDFIGIPENIPIVDDQATNDTNFVGCKSLLTASVYVLKYLNVDRRNDHQEIYRHTFRYAAQMDRHSLRSAMIPILDELLESRGNDVLEPGIVGLLLWMEKFGKSSLSIKMKKSSRQSSPRSLQYDLATIAADYGCLHYVERKVSEGLPTEYLKRCPLLWSVVCGFIEAEFTQRLWEIDHYIYILEFLVDQGAKVGATWQVGATRQVGDTWKLVGAWRYLRSSDALQLLLQESKTLSSMTSSDDTLQMMNSLLENGANPNRQFETKKDVEGHGLWYLADKGIWNYPLWKLLLKHGADPALKGGHDHRLLYFAILKGESKIAKLLCRAGADPTKLGQGINALRLEQCALAHFTYNKDDMRSFVENANRMQRMLQKFGNGVASSPAKPAEEVPSLMNAGEAVSHGTEDVRGTKNLSEDSDEDENPESPYEDTSDSSSSSSEDDNDGSDVEWQGRDRF